MTVNWDDIAPTFVKKAPGDEEIYICPDCLKPKLYWNTRKGEGWCHVCSEKFKSFDEEYEYVPNLEVNPEIRYKEQFYEVASWTKPFHAHPGAVNYLQSRGIAPLVAVEYGLRADFRSLVFTNKWLDGKEVDYYQQRFYLGSKKHYTPESAVKPLCWLDKATDKIAICEGFLSALSIFQADQSWRPVVLQGKSLTKLQLEQLSKHCWKLDKLEVLICLDGGVDHMELTRKLQYQFQPDKMHVCKFPADKDPNDLLLAGSLVQYLEQAQQETYDPIQQIFGDFQ